MYVSTRGEQAKYYSAAVIIKGLAGDGGLYVPEVIPRLANEEMAALTALNYRQRAGAILAKLLTDYSDGEIAECVENAYTGAKFDHPAVAPVVRITGDFQVLELWHGPTSAFKDMALQLLPRLMAKALFKTGEKNDIVILVATSGDTGKAALEGFKNVPRIKIIVFYPRQGVSEIQRRQMISQEGENTAVIGLEGNFDDAQTGVKSIFRDQELAAELARKHFQFSSANSINWGRLVPQIVYYFSAYADLVKNRDLAFGQPVNFVVPTGNFGNILAGYYAKRMGLPIRRLICASNSNNVLTDFLRTGIYDRRRSFYKTISPSMDILVSSNLERLLYHLTGGDKEQVGRWMAELAGGGRYDIGPENLAAVQELFWADWVDDDQTRDTIRSIYQEHHYLSDPHTAVAWRAGLNYRRQTGDNTRQIIVSTASPFKFNASVLPAVRAGNDRPAGDEFAMLEQLAKITGWSIPPALAALKTAVIRHKTNCTTTEMPAMVKQLLS